MTPSLVRATNRPVVSKRWRALLTVVIPLLLALPVSQAAAQGAGQDTIKTQTERILDKLKALRPLLAGDSLPPDTTDSAALAAQPKAPAQGVALVGAGGSLGSPTDSITRVLLGIPGYTVTEYQAGQATFWADSSTLQLRDSATVVRLGNRLTADSTITYYQLTALACATGRPIVTMAGGVEPIRSDSVCYNTNTNIGTVVRYDTRLSEGVVWNVRGDNAYVVRGETEDGTEERVYSHAATFTDCELDEPHYHFAAKELKAVRGDLIVARNVTLNFGDVPVFWVPFFVQSLRQDRRSGLLTPRFGINDIARQSVSYNRRIENVGFYWAISDFFGSEFALDYHSNNYVSMRGSLDYFFRRQFLRGALTFRRFWKAEGGQDFTVATNNSWQPDERTRMSVTGNYATSTQFVRERSYDPRELNRSIASNLGVNRRFDWGTVSLSGSRQQYLSDNSVQMTLPSATVNLNSQTLFAALPGEESWYSNLTWTGNVSTRVNTRDISEADAPLSQRDQREITASASNSFRLGRFSLSQGADLRQQTLAERAFAADSIDDLARREDRMLGWDLGLTYQQPLIGTSTLSPRLSLSGSAVRDSVDGRMVAGPLRMNFGASLNTAVFGFWGGVGPFEAIRHRFSPSISYNYSPSPTTSERQERLFNTASIREENRISIGLNQTFEAKYHADEDSISAGAPPPADTLGLPGPDTLGFAADTAPRRRPPNRVIKLLSINTSAVTCDFVAAREDGHSCITTTRLSNNIQTDLLPGIQFRIEHDLFETIDIFDVADPSSVIDTERRFAPHVSNLSTSFSLSSESPLMRAIGLGRRDPAEEEEDDEEQADTLGVPEGFEPVQAGQGALIGEPRRNQYAQAGPVGSWNASLSYSLTRPRDGEGNQMLTGTISMQPTELWSVNWRTGYSFTRGEFTDHVLTLTRRLHDFDANFDFFKAQNGNFAFQFRVELRAAPDLKFDYEQRDLPNVGG